MFVKRAKADQKPPKSFGGCKGNNNDKYIKKIIKMIMIIISQIKNQHFFPTLVTTLILSLKWSMTWTEEVATKRKD